MESGGKHRAWCKTQGLVENTGLRGTHGANIFLPKYEFSLLK